MRAEEGSYLSRWGSQPSRANPVDLSWAPVVHDALPPTPRSVTSLAATATHEEATQTPVRLSREERAAPQ